MVSLRHVKVYRKFEFGSYSYPFKQFHIKRKPFNNLYSIDLHPKVYLINIRFESKK